MPVHFRNRQRVRRVNIPLLRRMTRLLLENFCGIENYELCIHLVAAPEMARVNQQFLQHEGSTDVITFDFEDSPPASPSPVGRERAGVRVLSSLHGEIYICLDDALKQSHQFRTTWQSEVIRYVIHGVLHLLGHDDLKPAARKKMKREENRLLQEISRNFPIIKLARTPS